MSVETTSLYNETMPVIDNHLYGPSVDHLFWAYQVIDKYSVLARALELESIKADEVSKDSKYTEKDYHQAKDIIRWNSEYLRKCWMSRIKVDNISRVIDAINKDGKFHFNMSVFFGMISKENNYDSYIPDVGLIASSCRIDYRENFKLENPAKKFDEGNQGFGCRAVGCIAGYAVGSASEWDERKISFVNLGCEASAFQAIACNYFGIPLEVGSKIFFPEDGSLWSWIKVMIDSGRVEKLYTDLSVFNDLEWNEETQSNLEGYTSDEDNWEDNAIEFSSITYQMAAEVLRLLKNKTLTFNEDDCEPMLVISPNVVTG